MNQLNYPQKGFSPIIIVGLLALGIVAGTLLVQNGVSFIPKAAEQEALNPVTKEKLDACGNDNDCKSKVCEKDTVTYCDNRAGTPRAIRKSGGYYDPSNPHKEDSGCVFDYREVDGKKSECAKSESQSGDVVYTTKEEAAKLDADRAQQVRSGGDPSSAASSQTTACSPQATKTYYDAKVANNLARFYAIIKGAGGLCVPADLGVPEKDDVTVNGVEGRLLMCSSKDSPPKLYWMIASYKDNSLISVPEDQKPAPDIYTIESGFKNLQKVRCISGLDSGDKCNGV